VSQERLIGGLRSSLDTFNRTGEIDASILAPDFEMHQASSIIDTAGVFRGPDALTGALAELRGAFTDLKFEGERFIPTASGEIVALIQVRGRGQGSGMQLENHIAWVWTFRDDLAVKAVVYEEPADALAAYGLAS